MRKPHPSQVEHFPVNEELPRQERSWSERDRLLLDLGTMTVKPVRQVHIPFVAEVKGMKEIVNRNIKAYRVLCSPELIDHVLIWIGTKRGEEQVHLVGPEEHFEHWAHIPGHGRVRIELQPNGSLGWFLICQRYKQSGRKKRGGIFTLHRWV